MILRFALWTSAAVILFGCGAAPEPLRTTSARAPSDARHEAGRNLYNFRCYYCHGYSGDARTLASRFLEPRPRDFSVATPQALPREAILSALRSGRPGTAMKSYAGILSNREMALVADFVHEEFVVRKARNTRYHTPENGWPDHERFSAAFPFVRGELAVDVPTDSLLPALSPALSPDQAAGGRLYLSTCVSCHDTHASRSPSAWEVRALAPPRPPAHR